MLFSEKFPRLAQICESCLFLLLLSSDLPLVASGSLGGAGQGRGCGRSSVIWQLPLKTVDLKGRSRGTISDHSISSSFDDAGNHKPSPPRLGKTTSPQGG